MTTGRFAVALTAGLFATAVWAPAATGPPAPAQVRMRAVGIDPADARLAQKLKQRLEAMRAASAGRRVFLATRALPSGDGGSSRRALPSGLSHGRKKGTLVAVGSIALADPPAPHLSSYGIQARVKLHDRFLESPEAWEKSGISYRVTEPVSGLDSSGKLEACFYFGCNGYDQNGDELMSVWSLPSTQRWAFGAKPRNVSLRLSAPGFTSFTRVFPVVGDSQEVKITVAIDSAPPFLPSNAFGMQASSAQFGGTGARSSDGDPWTPTTGEDTLGFGVNLGAGYTVKSTKIVAAQSQLDPPGTTNPENAYRFAKVKTNPDGGRLQTVVEWMYGPGESLAYTIEWTLTGPMGQRPLMTMPASGPVDQ